MIEGKTTDVIVEQVQSIPWRQRRIILYTGVHPNEATTELSRPYETDWRNYGTLIVAHPSTLTPQGIWERHKQVTGGEFFPLSPNIEIDEDAFEEDITQGDPTVIVRFHGSPSIKDATYKNTLEILPSMHADECINPDLFRTIGDFFPNVEHLGYPANRICVEYWYTGVKPTQPTDPFVLSLLQKSEERWPNHVPKIFHPDDTKWWTKDNLSPDYLTAPKPNKAAIRNFHQVHAHTLGRLLEHVYRGLSRK